MASYVSKDGKLYPAKESYPYQDKNGEYKIYSGPDRGAVAYMKEQGLDPEKDYLGMDFTEDSQIIERAHDKNMTVEQFTKQGIHTKEKRDADYKVRASKIVNHQPLPRKPKAKISQSGGLNTAGQSGHLEGGFGDIEDAKRSVKQ